MEQIDAYKRSLSASWDSRAAIIPINKWKDGVGKAINFSYFSPYDVVKQPFSAALKTLEEGKVRQEDAGNVAWNLMLGEDGPVRKLLDPFISEAIFFEKVLDTLPSGVGFGGRGGVTKTGSRVYSITDDGPEAFMKSLVHIIEGVQPTAITTAGKLVQGLEKDLKRGGQPVTLQDELLALFSGIRIINVDVPKAMQFKVTDYQKKFRSVTTTEKLFSLENYQNRGPLVLADEFRQIQDETLKVNREFHLILQDALKTGVPKKDLIKILRNRRIPYAKVKKLLDGKNIPYTAYEERMKDRVKAAEKIAKETGSEKPTDVAKKRLPIYTVNENFLKTRSAIINDSETLREIMGEIFPGDFNILVEVNQTDEDTSETLGLLLHLINTGSLKGFFAEAYSNWAGDDVDRQEFLTNRYLSWVRNEETFSDEYEKLAVKPSSVFGLNNQQH